jgi:hypothetical protein
MSHAEKTTDPRDYMGVYKTLDDVPDRYRFHQHAAAYDGHDVFQEFLDERLFEGITSDTARREIRRTERRWKSHMDERGRHHALATPDDVEAWFADLLDRFAKTTLQKAYFRTLEGFFTWLQNHTDHPHVYHPVWMASAVPDTATRELWDYKIERTRRPTE